MDRTGYAPNTFAAGRAESSPQIGSFREIASYSSYPEAEAAVDALADEGFPVENVAIVADGLQYVENVTGRRGYAEATLNGFAGGAITGALIGFFLGLFNVVEPLVSGFVLAFWGIVIGGIIGAVIGAASMWMSQGRRNFDSVTGVQAERYVVLCDPEVAPQALGILGAAGPAR